MMEKGRACLGRCKEGARKVQGRCKEGARKVARKTKFSFLKSFLFIRQELEVMLEISNNDIEQ